MALLAAQEIDRQLIDLPGWKLDNGELTKTFGVKSFAYGVILIGAIAQLAEAANHHPDVSLHGYRNVTVRLSTHSENGITEKDFKLASQIEHLPQKG